MLTIAGRRLDVFATSPQSKDFGASAYNSEVAKIARLSEEAGCRGILVYTDNSIIDPWICAQRIVESTDTLEPLVAVQPVYMHPYAVAKMVSSIGFMHGRRVCLNLLAGGFKNDLVALGDESPHDERYARMTEYGTIIRHLLETDGPVTFRGRHYRVENLKMTPPLPRSLAPGILCSGSSPAALESAKAIGAVAVRYPDPPGEVAATQDAPEVDVGIRVGIICRDTDREAWKIAEDRFPESRRGQISHALTMKVSDSHWHRQLSERQKRDDCPQTPYWLGPFANGRTFCPYLVGKHEAVADEVARYLTEGYRTFILDIPPNQLELAETRRMFEIVEEKFRTAPTIA